MTSKEKINFRQTIRELLELKAHRSIVEEELQRWRKLEDDKLRRGIIGVMGKPKSKKKTVR